MSDAIQGTSAYKVDLSRVRYLADILAEVKDKGENFSPLEKISSLPTAANAGSDKLSSYYSTSANHVTAQEYGSSSEDQEVEESSATKSSAVDDFRAYMKKTPAERMRDQILAEMGLTENDLKNMSPEKLKSVLRELAQRIEEKMRQASGVEGRGVGEGANGVQIEA